MDGKVYVTLTVGIGHKVSVIWKVCPYDIIIYTRKDYNIAVLAGENPLWTINKNNFCEIK